MQAESYFSAHISHFLLHELSLSKRATELFAVHCVFTCSMEAEFSCSHCTPSDTESGLIEAAEWTLETLDIQDIFLGHLNVVHHYHPSY